MVKSERNGSMVQSFHGEHDLTWFNHQEIMIEPDWNMNNADLNHRKR